MHSLVQVNRSLHIVGYVSVNTDADWKQKDITLTTKDVAVGFEAGLPITTNSNFFTLQ